MNFLKKSTAVTLKLGPFVDNVDGYTPEEGLTINQANVRLSKNGGAFAQKNEASAGTHDENAWYGIPLDDTDTNTCGVLTLAIYVSGALPVYTEYTILPGSVYDSLIAGSKSELTAEPATDANFVDDVKFLAMALRNGGAHDRDAGTLTVNNDAGSAICSCTVSDTGGSSGTLTRGKMS